jgi:hypothetical protein
VPRSVRGVSAAANAILPDRAWRRTTASMCRRKTWRRALGIMLARRPPPAATPHATQCLANSSTPTFALITLSSVIVSFIQCRRLGLSSARLSPAANGFR